jgi:molybdenum cofactor guanylyltransferase
MGSDKSILDVGGMTLAARAGGALAVVARPVLVVGPDVGTGFESVPDDHEGPLAAFASGGEALREQRCLDPIVLVACDLPFVSAELLTFIGADLGEADASVPMLDDRDQPLVACYASHAASVARDLVKDGRRAMRDLLESIAVHRIPERRWTRFAPKTALMDLDTPADLEAARRLASG